MWKCCVATGGHGDIQAQAATEGHVWVFRSTTARIYMDVHGPYCHNKDDIDT